MSDETPWWEVYQSLGFMTSGKQLATLQAWGRLFDQEGRTNEEMTQAVYAIARRDKLPSFAEEHLQAIREELRAIDESQRQQEPVVVNRAPCPFCYDCGIVCGLPHSRQITNDGVWTGTIGGPASTQCAKCDRCNVGRSIGGNMITLTQYESRNPHWSLQLEFYRQYQALESEKDRVARKDPSAQYPESSAEAELSQKLSESIEKILAKVRA